MDLLRHLSYFIAVAEECHFGRAAERLHMAQPPLSQSIRRLESHLGAQLLERTTRRVELTRAGQVYLDRARAVLAGVDAAADEARRVAAGSLGHLTIGCVGSATYSLLPALARRLADERPGVDFDFRGDMLVSDQVRALREGGIDLGLLRPPVSDPGLVLHHLRDEALVVAIPMAHPWVRRAQIDLVDLSEADLIVHSAGRRSAMFSVVSRLFDVTGTVPSIRHEVGETSTLLTLVAGGLGLAVVPETVSSLHVEGVAYRPLLADEAWVPLAAAHRVGRREPHLVRTVEILLELTATAGDRVTSEGPA